jgi:sensor histidine kinase YesM
VVWIYIRSLDKQKLLKIENKNAKVKMSALSSQINSHFIANTLVSIKNYINQNDIFKGSEVIDDFSLLMRQILIKSQESLIPLKEDIEILKLYIQLEIENNSHSFDYEINICPANAISAAGRECYQISWEKSRMPYTHIIFRE